MVEEFNDVVLLHDPPEKGLRAGAAISPLAFRRVGALQILYLAQEPLVRGLEERQLAGRRRRPGRLLPSPRGAGMASSPRTA